MGKGMNTKVIDVKEHSNKTVGLLVQAVLTLLVLIFGIIIIIDFKFLPVFYAVVSITMFTMAYNNNKFYHKKNMTAIYIIIGLFVLITTVMEYLA